MICEPNVDGDGGIPAGCQVDKSGNLYVADMRLGILYVKPDGTFTQVMIIILSGQENTSVCSYSYL